MPANSVMSFYFPATGLHAHARKALVGALAIASMAAATALGAEGADEVPRERIVSEARDALSVLDLISREAHFTAEVWRVDLKQDEDASHLLESLPEGTVANLPEERDRIVAALENLRASLGDRVAPTHFRAEVKEHRGRHLEHTWPAEAKGAPTTWLTSDQARTMSRRLMSPEFDMILEPLFPPSGFVRITPGRFHRWEYDLTGLLFLYAPSPAFYGDQDIAVRDGAEDGQHVLSYKTVRWGRGAVEEVMISSDAALLPVTYVASRDGTVVAKGRFYYSTGPGFVWPLSAISLIGGERGWRLQVSVFHEFRRLAATDLPLRLRVAPRMAMFEEIGGQRAFGYAGFPERWPKSWGDMLELDGKPLTESAPEPPRAKDIAARLLDIAPAVLLALAALGVLLLRTVLRRRAASAAGACLAFALGLGSLASGCGRSEGRRGPISIDLGTLAAGSQRVERKVEVSNPTDSKWVVEEVERSCRCAVVGMSKGDVIPARSSRAVDLSFMPPSIPGPFEERIAVHFEGNRSDPQLILIRGTLEGLLQVSPRLVEFDNVPRAGTVERRVLLAVTSQDKLNTLSVRGCPVWLSVTVPTLDPKRPRMPSETWPITVAVKGDALAASARCEIEVVVTDAKGRETILPVGVAARRGSALAADAAVLMLDSGNDGERHGGLVVTDTRPRSSARTGPVVVVRSPTGTKAEVAQVDEEKGVARVTVVTTSPAAILGMLEVSAWGESLIVPIAAAGSGQRR